MPTLAEALAGDFTCPPIPPTLPPPPPSVCEFAGFDIRVSVPESDSTLALRIKCGQKLDGQTIVPCALVSAHTERDGVSSVTTDAMSYPIDGCHPVPEAPFGAGLAICLIAAVATRSRLRVRRT